jgi:hypothetical protein
VASFVLQLLGLLDAADERHQAQVDAQVCPEHPNTTIAESSCPLCALDDRMLQAALDGARSARPVPVSLRVQRNMPEQTGHNLPEQTC